MLKKASKQRAVHSSTYKNNNWQKAATAVWLCMEVQNIGKPLQEKKSNTVMS